MSTNVFGLYDTDPVIKKMQRALNEKLSLELKCDGNIGKVTQEAIKNYQVSVSVVETDEYGPAYGPKTQVFLDPFIQTKYLNDSAFTIAANQLGTELACVKAVTTVEAKEFGFLNNGFPVTLFERHKFYSALIKNKGVSFADTASAKFPDICNKDTGGYVGGSGEIVRLQRAIAIDNTSAVASASYGLFQIMGFNYAAAGYISAEAYYAAMKISESNQLMAFVNFVKANPRIHQALKAKDWATFALLYNGPGYKVNNYDVKMNNAYASFK